MFPPIQLTNLFPLVTLKHTNRFLIKIPFIRLASLWRSLILERIPLQPDKTGSLIPFSKTYRCHVALAAALLWMIVNHPSMLHNIFVDGIRPKDLDEYFLEEASNSYNPF